MVDRFPAEERNFFIITKMSRPPTGPTDPHPKRVEVYIIEKKAAGA
jgi:hypothetical protein